MKRGAIGRAVITLMLGVLAGVALSADTLYLKNGTQVRGQLVSIVNGTVEFRESSGWTGRTLRVDQADVQRIDFDDNGYGDRDRGRERGDDRSGGRRPSGLREREVVVSADVPWIDSGIEVRSGQTLYFEAVGKVTWGKGRKDGPEGESNSPRNPGRPIPNRPGAALIGKIGEGSQDYFFIGDERGGIRVRGSGRLFLGINDDMLQDNQGNFRVTVYY